MEPVDLLCSRNARPQKDGDGAARCPYCSQNAHIENVLAWDKSASRRARGWAGENVARNKRFSLILLGKNRSPERDGPFLEHGQPVIFARFRGLLVRR